MLDPWLAFSTAAVHIPGLLEGIVFPDRDEGGLGGCFFNNKNRDLFAEARVAKEPVLVRVLVGTKDGIEKWLVASGPASCALWVEVAEENAGPRKCITGQLRVAYRLRSRSACSLDVLSGVTIVLSWYQKAEIADKGGEGLVSRWLLVMPSKAFRHLLCMIEPGGVLAELQLLFRQLVDCPNFLDVRFEYLDLHFWLARYPFLLFFDNSSLLVLTRDFAWTALKFDCFDGIMLIGKGGAVQKESGGALDSGRSLFQVQEWSLWEEASAEKDARRIGPLGSVVFNNFYVEGKGFIGGIAVQELLDCVAESWKEGGRKMKYISSVAGATVFKYRASNLFPAVRLSAEERSAFASLCGISKSERRQAIKVLIDLLLIDNGPGNMAGAAASSMRGIVPSARDSVINWSTFHESDADNLTVSSNKSGGSTGIGWMRLLEWVDRSFFEALLDDAVEDYDTLDNVQKVAEAILRIINVIPGEASARLGASCMEQLKNRMEKVHGLLCPDATKGSITSQTREADASFGPVKAFQELICISAILSVVLQGSSVVGVVVAEHGGLSLALEAFLELATVFSPRSGGSGCQSSVLPGEILESPVLLCPLVGSGSLAEGPWTHGSSGTELTRINSMLEARLKGPASYDQSNIKKAFHSSGLAKVLMKLILRKMGTASVVDLSPNPGSKCTRVNNGRFGKISTVKLNLRSRGQCMVSSVLTSFVSDAKYHLLSAAAIMLGNKCSASSESKQKLVVQYSGQAMPSLVGRLVVELIQASRRGVAERVYSNIFQILFSLDKVADHPVKTPVPVRSTRFSVAMLSEVGDHLKDFVRQQESPLKDENQDDNASSWIKVATLLQVLTTFIGKWPTEKPASLVFQYCESQLEALLDIMSSQSNMVDWTSGQLLVMQNIIRLFGASTQHEEVDDAVWKLLVENTEHWELIKRYSHWLVFDACQECLWSFLEEYCWSVWEPLEVQDLCGPINMGSSSASWLPRWLPGFQCEEIPLKSLVSFLRLMVSLIQRKVGRDKDCSNVMAGRTRLVLDFLMDPVNGILMKLLKGEYSHNRKQAGPVEASYFHLKHVRQDVRSLIPFCTQRKLNCNSHRQILHSAKVQYCSWKEDYAPLQDSLVFQDSQPHNLSYLAATNVEVAGLQLLASIFSLSFWRPDEELNSPLQQRLATGNPFLSPKYAYPFLDFHFLRLVQLYYINVLQSYQPVTKTVERALEKVSEATCTVEWCTNYASGCSELDIRDEQVSLECAVHVQVLVALAQNLNEDLSLRLKQLKVMDFLVHQISLEYEASQVATPRDVIRISKSLAAQLRSSNTSKSILKSQGSESSSSVTTPSVAGLKKVACTLHSPESGGPGSRVVGKHIYALSKDIPKLELGFLSARNMGSQDRAQLSCESYLLSRPYTGRHEFLLKWHEVMRPNVTSIARKDPEQESSGGERNVSVPESHESEGEMTKGSPKEYLKAEDVPDGVKLIYGGKFFDLNEEVERELAEEDPGQDSQDEKSADDETERDSEDESIEASGADDKCHFTALRPFIPKLNLPKSARKGEHESASASHSTTTTTDAKPVVLKFEKKSPGIPLSVELTTSNSSSSKHLTASTPYELEKINRRLYGNSSLHLFLLELYITLMLTPQGTLDQNYSDRFQTEKQKLNAPFFLFYHLNHAANAHLLPFLAERMKAYHTSAFRILRLSWTGLFNSSLYKNRIRIAHGAFSQIYKATVDNEETGPQLVVLKTVEIPKGPYEPCKFFDVYSEVQILEKFVGEPRVCQLLDYGVEPEAFVLVLKHYKCSLRTWRLSQGCCMDSLSGRPQKSFYERLPLYLEVYAAVLDAVKVLEMHNVVHYDLKCDNVLLEPVDSEEAFWDPVWPPADSSNKLPFKVCLTDFGQSKASMFQGGECTYRNRGTEFVKSPEMLKLLCSNSDMSMPDASVGKAVDVWGLGCLLYELLAAEYLLYDEDWMRFFVRLTMQSEDLITSEKAEKVGNFRPVVDFIRFVLVRDPSRRPTLDEVMVHLKQLQTSLIGAETGKLQKDENAVTEEAASTVGVMDGLEKSSKSSVASWLCCGCWGRGDGTG